MRRSTYADIARTRTKCRLVALPAIALVTLVSTCALPTSAGATTSPMERIYAGHDFSVGEVLSSTSQVYRAELAAGAVVKVLKNGTLVWSSHTPLTKDHAFALLRNGNVEIRGQYAFGTTAAMRRTQSTSYLTVLDNGDLALIAKSGVVTWQTGPAAHLSTSSPLYTPGEFYGNTNPSAVCYTCEASTVTGNAPPSNTLDAGTQVDALTGDFITTNDLFSAPAIGGSLGLSLSYDAQLAQSQLIAGTPAPLFGYGWTSNLSMSISAASSTETVTQENGAEVTFNQSANGGTSVACETAGGGASGDYPSAAKYTVVGSSTQWCALASVEGQLGQIGSTGMTYETNGGQKIDDFAWNGQLEEQTTNSDSASMPVEGISFLYGVTGGSLATTASGVTLSEQCPSGDMCDIAYASDGRSLVEVVNGSGLVTSVISPAGTTYTLTYDANENLVGVAQPQSTSTTSVWNYVYAESSGWPWSSDLEEIYDPDANVATPASFTPGAAHSTTINYFGSTSATPGMVASLSDGVLVAGQPSTTAYSYTASCAPTSSQPVDQCFNQGAQQVTTITYPPEAPCPGASCTAQSPVEIDQYSAGIETSSQLGSVSTAIDDETWLFSWNFGDGTANSSEVVTYPDTLRTNTSLGAQAPTATIVTDPAGNIVATTNALGDVATSLYNDVGANNLPELLWSFPGPVAANAASSSTPPPGSWSYTYNSYGQAVTATDPLGNVTTYGYYQADSLLCFVAPPSVSQTLSTVPTCTSSSASSDQGAIGAPVGSTTYGYDVQGDTVTTTIDAGDTAVGADPQTTTSDYDVLGNQLWNIPATGQSLGQSSSNPYATVTTYSLANQPLTVAAPDANVTNFTYDLAGNTTSVTTPAATTTMIYDGDNRDCYTVTAATVLSGLSCSSVAQAGSTSTSYLPGSATVASRTDAKNDTTSYYYADLAYPSSPTEVVDPLGTAITYMAYDDDGNRCLSGDVPIAVPSTTQCSWEAGDTATSFNALGSALVITNPNGPGDNVITNTYNDAAYPTNLTSTTNGLASTTRYSYDADGRLVTTLNANQTAETEVYNANGEICARLPTSSIYPCGEGPATPGVSQYSYNLAGDLISMSDNVGNVSGTGSWSQTSTFSYVNGQLTSTTDANNKTISYLYNDAGQVACEAYPVSTNATCGSVTAPVAGSTTNTVVHRTYDPAGRLVTSSDWLGNTVTYAYADASDPSAVTTITYPSSTNLATTYNYDAAGELLCLSTAAPSTTTSPSTPPSCATTGSLESGAWTYNGDDETLTSSVNGANSGSVLYNANRQITAATNLGASTTNDAYTIANNAEIASDQSPSGTSIGFSYNTGDELTCASTTSGTCATATSATKYAYDANGSRTSATTTSPGTASVTTNYSWNAQGELCGVGPANLSCGATPASGTSYTYDGLGLRDQTMTPTSTMDSTWDTVSGGSLPLNINDATSSSSATTNTSYLYGDLLFGGVAPVEQIVTSGSGSTPVFLISSPTGVQGVVSATGSLLESAVYSLYGTQQLATGTSKVTPFGFQGSYTDATGLVYLIDRYYDPTTDSFISVDPDVQVTDQPYAFTNDDPLNATDPLGLEANDALIKYDAAAAANRAYCDKHPDALGHSCGGLIHEVAGTISKGYDTASNFSNHVVVGFGLCIGACANISLQGSTLTLSIGGSGTLEKGVYVGYANLLPDKRNHTQAFFAGGAVVGASTEFGVNPNGSINYSDWEVDAGQFGGIAGGVLWSKSIDLLP